MTWQKSISNQLSPDCLVFFRNSDFDVFPLFHPLSDCTQIRLLIKSNAIQCSSAIVESLNKSIRSAHKNKVTMGNKSSLFLRNEEIAQIQEETGCEYDILDELTLGIIPRDI